MSDYVKIAENVFRGDARGTNELIEKLINEEVNPLDIINEGLIRGMNMVAPKFKAGEMFVPEVMMAARAMSSGMEIVKPLIADADIPSAGKVVIGSVKGDLHDIGKNLVAMILESGGFKVIDLGVDISPEIFVDAIKEHKPQIIGMSALLTTTMMSMKDTIDALQEANLRDSVKVLIGGAPVSQSFADEIKADGYCADAIAALEMASHIVA